MAERITRKMLQQLGCKFRKSFCGTFDVAMNRHGTPVAANFRDKWEWEPTKAASRFRLKSPTPESK